MANPPEYFRSPISNLQKALICEYDSKVLGGTLKAAQEVREATANAEAAAQALARARIIRDMDEIALNKKEVDICEMKKLDDQHIQANLYFASWSRMKERHLREKLAQGHAEAVDMQKERDFVTRLAGDALLRWNWIGPVDWCNLPIRQASDGRTEDQVKKEIMDSRQAMMKTMYDFYRSQNEFELIGVEFILRSPSFQLPDARLNDFFRELIDGATVMMKLKVRSRPMRSTLAVALGGVLGLDCLASRTLAPAGFSAATAVAFWRTFPVGAVKHICSFLPSAHNMASCLRDLAKHHNSCAAEDTKEMERILARRTDVPAASSNADPAKDAPAKRKRTT